MKRIAKVVSVISVLLAGCEKASEGETAKTTNVVTITETVTVTNTINVVVTNFVKVAPEIVLSSRKTAPYEVTTTTMGEQELARLLRSSGARILECKAGASALIEAPSKVVEGLNCGGVMRARMLEAGDKIAPDAFEQVKIIPMSSIDCAKIAQAVKAAGGTLVQVVTKGAPVIRAKMSSKAVRELAARGDVLSIKKDTL